MTPAEESALGSSEAMVMSKALVAAKGAAIQRAVRRADTRGRGRCGRGWVLTRVVNVVEGSGQDLEGASEVQKIELVVQGEEHINWLVVGHCTRLGGHLGQLGWWDG